MSTPTDEWEEKLQALQDVASTPPPPSGHEIAMDRKELCEAYGKRTGIYISALVRHERAHGDYYNNNGTTIYYTDTYWWPVSHDITYRKMCEDVPTPQGQARVTYKDIDMMLWKANRRRDKWESNKWKAFKLLKRKAT